MTPILVSIISYTDKKSICENFNIRITQYDKNNKINNKNHISIPQGGLSLPI